MYNFVDLQTHSNTRGSDGSLTVLELVNHIWQNAGENALWSLTDHNTTDGLLEAQELSKKMKLRFIPGCEVMVFAKECGNFEILGYGTYENITHIDIACLLSKIRDSLRNRIEHQLNLWYKSAIVFAGYKIGLTEKEYFAMHSRVEKYNDWDVFGAILSQKLQELFPDITIATINKIFYQYFREPGGSLYIPYNNVDFPTPQDLIALFSRHNIVSVLSHPGEYHMKEQKRDEMIRYLISEGVNGIEVFTRKNSDQQIEKYLDVALKKNLVITGGSDFHLITSQYKVGFYRKDKKISDQDPFHLYERIMT